jgi:hypothetical protein
MSKNIYIKEAVFDKTSDFNVKRFKLGNIDIERPTKILDAKKINQPLFEEEKSHFKNILFETSKIIDADSITKLLHQPNSSRVRDWFSLKEWIMQYPHTLSLTFDFNPYTQYQKIDDLSGFFNYYYEFSDTVLLVPNIKIEKYELTIDAVTQEKKGKSVPIMAVDKYLQFVDDAYHILDEKNHKPIFVPLSLRLSIDDIKRVAEEYVKNEFFNIWIDFEGSATTIRAKRARIREFLLQMKRLERLNEIVVYCTNVKREIISNPVVGESPSSDVLTSVIGANLIGVNRERRGFGEPIDKTLPAEEQQKLKDERKKKTLEIKEHKARIFNPTSYYYRKVKEMGLNTTDYTNFMNEKYNILHNALLLDSEFKSQTEYFLEKGNHSIEKYISDKPMIKEYQKGELVKTLFNVEKKVTEWF